MPYNIRFDETWFMAMKMFPKSVRQNENVNVRNISHVVDHNYSYVKQANKNKKKKEKKKKKKIWILLLVPFLKTEVIVCCVYVFGLHLVLCCADRSVGSGLGLILKFCY